MLRKKHSDAVWPAPLTGLGDEVDNAVMSYSSTATTTATLGFLTSEAALALQEAKRLREQLASLPEGDPQRSVLEKAIQDLLDRSRRFSTVVTSTASSS